MKSVNVFFFKKKTIKEKMFFCSYSIISERFRQLPATQHIYAKRDINDAVLSQLVETWMETAVWRHLFIYLFDLATKLVTSETPKLFCGTSPFLKTHKPHPKGSTTVLFDSENFLGTVPHPPWWVRGKSVIMSVSRMASGRGAEPGEAWLLCWHCSPCPRQDDLLDAGSHDWWWSSSHHQPPLLFN